jgi:hypothetical protein
MKSLFSVKNEVEKLLKENPTLRDDDRKLILQVWTIQHPDLLRMQGMNLIELFLNGQLATPETIRRTRQKLQQHNTSLRGETYKYRHNVEQPILIDELRDPSWRPGGTP